MAAHLLIPTEYNDFLFAKIGEQKNETPLSVLSTLARLDIDPWQEAVRLDHLSKDQAIRDITSSLGALPGKLWTVPETGKIAARLVELLPSQKHRASSPGADRMGYGVVVALTLMSVVFAGAWMASVTRTSSGQHEMHAANSISTSAQQSR